MSRDHDQAAHWGSRLYWRCMGVVWGCLFLAVIEGVRDWREDHPKPPPGCITYNFGDGPSFGCPTRIDPHWHWQQWPEQDDCNTEATSGQCVHDPEEDSPVFRS